MILRVKASSNVNLYNLNGPYYVSTYCRFIAFRYFLALDMIRIKELVCKSVNDISLNLPSEGLQLASIKLKEDLHHNLEQRQRLVVHMCTILYIIYLIYILY